MPDGADRLRRAGAHLHVGATPVRVSVVGSGPPVLLCSGLASPLESWGPLVDALGAFRFIAFDAPGVGDSPPARVPLTIDRTATLAAAVLDHVGVGRAHVVGYSWGGAVAQHLAWRHPVRVDRLVLAATSVGLGAVPGLPWAFGPPLLEALTARGPRRARTSPVGILGQVGAIVTWSSWPFLHRIEAPTLVLAGTADLVVPALNARLLAWALPDTELALLAGIGHDVFAPAALDTVTPRLAAFFATGRGRVTPDQ